MNNELDAENKAAGRCPNCGGSGVVAAMAAINRTGDTYLNQKCRRCSGMGRYPYEKVGESMGLSGNLLVEGTRNKENK